MDIPDDAVDSFIEGWKQEFGEVLSRDAARSQLSRLTDLLLRLSEPLPDELKNKRTDKSK